MLHSKHAVIRRGCYAIIEKHVELRRDRTMYRPQDVQGVSTKVVQR